MKIQGNTEVIRNTEKTPESDKNMNVSGNEAGTESGCDQTGVIYEKSDLNELKYKTYNADGTVSGVSPASASSSDRSIQIALMNLGFYTGDIDGNLTSASMKKAIGNFQTVYGLTKNGVMDQSTKSKLDLVDSFRNRAASIVSENQGTDVIKDLNPVERKNFANIWTFLRLEMKVDAMHASAIMGNIKAESWFSSNNLQDENGNKKHHDPGYKYKTDDGKGYGIMQWTYPPRKQGLLDEADAMGLKPGDLNAQLAYFRTEMTSDMYCKREWTNFNAIKTLVSATDYFLNYIEMPSEEEAANSKEKRREYANQVYQLMYKL
ncbi:MAG: peptidoglycan-binding protein [Butyrivibrio sp.]|nr:peptidoglycan-binding protein [Butyrivibrio sp.]